MPWRGSFLFNRALTSSAFLFHHCRQITSGWKRKGSLASEGALISEGAATSLARRPRAETGAPGPLGVSMAAPLSGLKSAARGIVEWASRDFFAWRASRQILVAGLMLPGSGIALEEAVDDDPMEQELSVTMASVRDLIGS